MVNESSGGTLQGLSRACGGNFGEQQAELQARSWQLQRRAPDLRHAQAGVRHGDLQEPSLSPRRSVAGLRFVHTTVEATLLRIAKGNSVARRLTTY